MLSTKHNYTITVDKGIATIVLKKNGDDSKAKIFTVVCNSRERLIEHMDSLTETICNDFMKSAQDL